MTNKTYYSKNIKPYLNSNLNISKFRYYTKNRTGKIFFFIIIVFVFFLFFACKASSNDDLFWLPDSSKASDHFFFTKPQPHVSMEEKSIPRDMILHFLGKANHSIDIWCYGMNEKKIIDEVVQAQQRGVNIQITGSYDQDYSALKKAGITPQIRNTQTLQHAKVILIDKKILISGSGNFTRSGLFYNHNLFFYIKISPQEYQTIIQGLKNNGQVSRPVHITKWKMQILFAPFDGRYIQQKIIATIQQARHTIDYLIFSHTDPAITAALFSKNQEGVLIQGIYDDMNNDGIMDKTSQGKILNDNLGLFLSKIYLEGNRSIYIETREGKRIQHGGHLHHKTMILDNQTVLTGSYNWSTSARDKNLEIFFKIDHAGVARHLGSEFQRIKNNSRLLGRPPFLEEQIQPPTIQFDDNANTICLQSLVNNNSKYTAVFQIKNGIFGASKVYNFEPGQECLELSMKHVSSSGILKTSSYDFFSLTNQKHTYTILPGNSSNAQNNISRICATVDGCKAIELESFDPETGIFWFTKYFGSSLQARVWNQGGLTKWEPMTQLDGQVYQLASNSNLYQDSVVFFRRDHTQALEYAACIQYGATLVSNLKNFIRFLMLETGQNMVCYLI